MDFLSRRRGAPPVDSGLLPVLAASSETELPACEAVDGSLTPATKVSELLASCSDSCGLLPPMPFRAPFPAKYCNR